MKQIVKLFTLFIMLASVASFAWDPSIVSQAPENPATGIWIQQVGEIVEQPSTNATLYYTRYIGNKDRVKSVDYFYDGLGYLRYANKDTICGSEGNLTGADGIMHHPDGDLLVAGQGNHIYKVKKNAPRNACVAKNATTTSYSNDNGGTTSRSFWHVMVDPERDYVWANSMPGVLVRYRTNNDGSNNGLDNIGFRVKLNSANTDRRKDDAVTTVVWDTSGHAFFTYSDYTGGGCETDVNGKTCTDAMKRKYRAGAYFGYFTDTTWKTISNNTEANRFRGKVGDKVPIAFGKKILLDSLEGSHGATFDAYSNTIFIFGGSKIVQIKPEIIAGKMTAKVVAEIDLRKFFFNETKDSLTGNRTPSCRERNSEGLSGYCDGSTSESGFTPTVGWRLDQGTVDGHGHLFVASNTGHVVFVDYAANPKRYIDNNILVHLQWLDDFLDDLAPLDAVEVKRSSAHSTVEVSSSSYDKLSSREEWSVSSSSANSSSSTKTSSSSGIVPGSSEGASSSSDAVPGSSEGTSSSSDAVPGSSEGASSSSDAVPGSSEGISSSSGIVPGSSGTGSGTEFGSSSSGQGGSPGGIDFGLSSSSKTYFNPEWDRTEKGDEIVDDAKELTPATDKNPGDPGTITIGENVYYVDDKTSSHKLDFRENAVDDSVTVGSVISITLDADKVKEYFGEDVSELNISSDELILIDPKNPNPGNEIKVNADGSITVYVTSYDPVRDGKITITNGGESIAVVIDNINFYAIAPEEKIAVVKDADFDGGLDYVEIILEDAMSKDVELVNISLQVNGVTLNPTVKPVLSEDGTRIILNDVSDLSWPKNVEESSRAIITYKDKLNGNTYVHNDVKLIMQGTNIIKAAHAILDTVSCTKAQKSAGTCSHMDSLFVEFNIDVIPFDLNNPEMIIDIKNKGKSYSFGLGQVSKVYLPTKNIIIFVGDDLGLIGNKKDSVSLHYGKTFNNMPYITLDEYEREVPVTTAIRLPATKNVEYWDKDFDGVLDQVVINFAGKVTKENLQQFHMTFPWYSQNGKLIHLQAQPDYLKIDPKDSTKVIWNVVASQKLASGITSINDMLPKANIYAYYPVFDKTFANEESVDIIDKMSPVVSTVSLSYGKKADTLWVQFSEAINKIDGKDFFRYIHGKDTMDLLPTDISWSDDGKVASLIIDASRTTIMPGDSLMVVRGAKGAIQDIFGNIAGDDPSPVVISGLLNHLVESTNMGLFDDKDEVLHTLSSVNLRYVPSSTTKEELEKEGALGQLVQLGERFVPQLLDRAQIASDGSVDPSVLDSLDPEKVFISFVVNYFDHLGQYVNDTVITVPCNSPKFGGNCLNSDQKVFVNWNFKDHNGRFVGTGVYMVQFRMVVRYDKKKIEEEIKDKWGVRRKKKK